MATTSCERRCSAFYFTEDTFDGVPIPIRNHLESIPIFVENRAEIARTIDEKLGITELASSV